MPLNMMLRIHGLQQGFNLSDPGAEDALYEIESMRRFAGIELGEPRSRMRRRCSISGGYWNSIS